MQLLDMGDGYDGSHRRSASSSPKRPRATDGYLSSEDEEQDSGDGNTLDGNQQLPIKKRRTERRVPSAEARKAALRELNDKRVSKAARQTSDNNTEVTEKAKKPKKPKKKKPKKELRRLPDHCELVMGAERLDDLDMEDVVGKYSTSSRYSLGRMQILIAMSMKIHRSNCRRIQSRKYLTARRKRVRDASEEVRKLQISRNPRDLE